MINFLEKMMKNLFFLLPFLLILSGCVEDADVTTYSCGNTDCETWQVCNYDQCTLKPGFCEVDGDCLSKNCLEDHTCGPVDTEKCECETWESCDDLGNCLPKQGFCNDKDDCANSSCDTTTHECSECTQDRDCPAFKTCNDSNICVLKEGSCYTDGNCDGATPYCYVADNSCVSCLNDSHCSDDWKMCGTAGTCVVKPGQCDTNSDCTDPAKNLCGGSDSHTCVFDCTACEDHKECNAAATACVLKDNRCDDKSDCTSDQKCDDTNTCIFDCESCDTTWQQCNSGETACEAKAGMCGTDSDCTGEANDMTDCDEASHSCIFNCDSCTGNTTCNAAQDGCILIQGKCDTKDDCNADQICAGADSHTCVFDCTTCTGDMVCNSAQTACEFDCTICKDWETCDQVGNECVVQAGRCNGHSDCNSTLPVCDDSNNICVECTYEEQALCELSGDVCELSSGTCVTAATCIADPDVVIADDQFTFESYSGTNGYGDNYNPGNGGCSGYLSDGAAGEDLTFTVDLNKGDFLSVNLNTALGGDAILYLLSDCLDNNSCVSAADSMSSDEGERLSFNASADGTYLVVVDTWGSDYQLTYFNLDLMIYRQSDICSVDSCTADNTFCQSDLNGVPECICTDGFHDESGSCVADTVCNPNPCADAADGQTKCTDNAGMAECGCEDGHFLKDGICIPNTPCEPENPCTDPNKTVCTVSGDAAVCDCDPGFMDDGLGACVSGEACEASAELLVAGSVDYDTNGTCGFGDDTTPSVLSYPNDYSGEDRMFKVVLNVGDQLSVTVTDIEYSYDPSLYLLSSCEQGMSTYVTGIDDASNYEETLTFTATESGLYYLVIDTFLVDSCMTGFNLDTTITPEVVEPACFGTTEELTLGTTFASNTCGYINDYEPVAFDPYTSEGEDRVFKVELNKDDTLTVTVTDLYGTFDPSLYLLSSCEGDLGSIYLTGSDVTDTAETLTYKAPENGTYFLVVDNYSSETCMDNIEISASVTPE